MKTLYGWTGKGIEKPRLLPGADALAEFVRVAHYDALDMDPGAVFAPAAPNQRDPSLPTD